MRTSSTLHLFRTWSLKVICVSPQPPVELCRAGGRTAHSPLVLSLVQPPVRLHGYFRVPTIDKVLYCVRSICPRRGKSNTHIFAFRCSYECVRLVFVLRYVFAHSLCLCMMFAVNFSALFIVQSSLVSATNERDGSELKFQCHAYS